MGLLEYSLGPLCVNFEPLGVSFGSSRSRFQVYGNNFDPRMLVLGNLVNDFGALGVKYGFWDSISNNWELFLFLLCLILCLGD